MTAMEAIGWVDEKKHNLYSLEDKLLWLGQVERMAAQLRGRCGLEGETAPLEPESVLTVPEDALYFRYLEAQIDYSNQEYLKYNNAMSLFTALWQEYANSLRRRLPGAGRRNFF